MLPGPYLANKIVGVLLRLGVEPLAVTGNMEPMYHQVKIPVEHRSSFRLLLRKNNDPQNKIVDHEMMTRVRRYNLSIIVKLYVKENCSTQC